MPILRATDAPTFDIGGNTITSFSAPSRGSREVLLYRVDVAPGGGLPPHRHDHDDVFTVVEGSLDAVLDGQSFEVAPGDTVVVPAGVLHHVEAGAEGGVIMVGMLAGTLFITDEGERVPPWGV